MMIEPAPARSQGPINLPAVPDLQDQDNQFPIPDGVHDPPVSYPDAPMVFHAGKFPCAWRSRIVRQGSHTFDYAPVKVARQGIQGFLHGAGKADAVGHDFARRVRI